MKISRQLVVSLFASLALVGPAARAASVNGSFEDGFTGWSTLGSASVVGSGFGVTAASGNFQALTTNSGGALPTSSIETFLSLSAGTLTAVAAAPGQPQEGSALKQTLTVNAGDVVSFSYNFLTSESTPDSLFNDFAFYSFNGNAFLLADTSTVFKPSASAFNQETGYRQVSFTVGTAGTYTLGFGVLDNFDTTGDSGLLVDNVQVTAIPEPSPLVGVLGLGVTGALVLLRRRAASQLD